MKIGNAPAALADGSLALEYEYDAASNRSRLIGPDGQVVRYEHDADERLEQIFRRPSASGAESLFAGYAYDDAGRPIELTRGNATRTSWTYDRRGLVTRVLTERSTGELLADHRYTRDERGDVAQMVAPHLGVTATYDYLDNRWLAAESYTGAISSSRTYAYDKNGNRTRAVRDGAPHDYLYDEENRIFEEHTQRTEPGSVQAGNLLRGRPFVDSTRRGGYRKSRLVDGDTSNSPAPRKSWRNRDTGRGARGAHFAGIRFNGAETISRFVFFMPTRGPARFAGLRRFQIEVAAGSSYRDVSVTLLTGAEPNRSAPGWFRTLPRRHRIEVDFAPVQASAIRILMARRGGSARLPNTMWLNEIQAFSPPSESPPRTASTTISYRHDADGNLIRRSEGGLVETYGYDYRNLLTSYVRNLGGGPAEASFAYGFSPTGERLSKTDLLGGVTDWLVYDGADVIADYRTSTSNPALLKTADYVNALSIDSKIARIDPSGTYYYTPDALGSATQLVNSTGGVVNQYLTTAWGEDLINGRPVPDRYGFTQRERDDESALMHYRARSYDPRLGRFPQQDPVIDNRPTETYVYAANSPTVRTDATGAQSANEKLAPLDVCEALRELEAAGPHPRAVSLEDIDNYMRLRSRRGKEDTASQFLWKVKDPALLVIAAAVPVIGPLMLPRETLLREPVRPYGLKIKIAERVAGSAATEVALVGANVGTAGYNKSLDFVIADFTATMRDRGFQEHVRRVQAIARRLRIPPINVPGAARAAGRIAGKTIGPASVCVEILRMEGCGPSPEMRDQIVIGDLADEIWGKGEILNQKTSGRTMSAIYEAYSYEAVAEYVLKQSQSREEMKEKLRALEIGTRGSPELEVAFDPDWVSCLPP